MGRSAESSKSQGKSSSSRVLMYESTEQSDLKGMKTVTTSFGVEGSRRLPGRCNRLQKSEMAVIWAGRWGIFVH